MRCYCCDAEITDKEIQYNSDGHFYEPCGTCLEIAMDAAYSDTFQYDEDVVTVLDPAFEGDATDVVYPPRKYKEDFDE